MINAKQITITTQGTIPLGRQGERGNAPGAENATGNALETVKALLDRYEVNYEN